MDRAATKTYVQAIYAWGQAAVANLPASSTAFDELASRIEAECPGVAAKALPPETGEGQTARQFGERMRKTEQLSELEGETSSALRAAWEQPNRQATAALAGVVRPLRWSNPSLTRQLQLTIARFEEGIDRPVPGVCGDFRAWAASGYRTLSAATKEYRSRNEALQRMAIAKRSRPLSLGPYEGPYERALIAKTKHEASEIGKALQGLDGSYVRVWRALGLASEASESSSTTQVVRRPPKRTPTKTAPSNSVKFLPGGLRPLVHGRAPGGGPGFAIIGQHYRFEGHDYFAMNVEITEGGGGGESPFGRRPKLFTSNIWTSCKPHEYAILYGLLKAPRDTVLARVAGKLQPLARVTIPASFHADGVLVYVAAATVPSELLVRTPSGKTLVSESFGRRATEETEQCEGESEGG